MKASLMSSLVAAAFLFWVMNCECITFDRHSPNEKSKIRLSYSDFFSFFLLLSLCLHNVSPFSKGNILHGERLHEGSEKEKFFSSQKLVQKFCFFFFFAVKRGNMNSHGVQFVIRNLINDRLSFRIFSSVQFFFFFHLWSFTHNL